MQGKVAICGTFDLYHAGHAGVLKFAKSLGDHLVVLLYNDHYAARYDAHPPIHPLVFRKAVLESIKYIDEIIVIENDLAAIVQQVRPDILVRGDDTDECLAVNPYDIVEHYDGAVITASVVYAESGERLSSSYIKTLIMERGDEDR